jgi:hypothetical protein
MVSDSARVGQEVWANGARSRPVGLVVQMGFGRMQRLLKRSGSAYCARTAVLTRKAGRCGSGQRCTRPGSAPHATAGQNWRRSRRAAAPSDTTWSTRSGDAHCGTGNQSALGRMANRRIARAAYVDTAVSTASDRATLCHCPLQRLPPGAQSWCLRNGSSSGSACLRRGCLNRTVTSARLCAGSRPSKRGGQRPFSGTSDPPGGRCPTLPHGRNLPMKVR